MHDSDELLFVCFMDWWWVCGLELSSPSQTSSRWLLVQQQTSLWVVCGGGVSEDHGEVGCQGWEACPTNSHTRWYQYCGASWSSTVPWSSNPRLWTIWKVCKRDSETHCTWSWKTTRSFHDWWYVGGPHDQECGEKNSSTWSSSWCLHQCNGANYIGWTCCRCCRGNVFVAMRLFEVSSVFWRKFSCLLVKRLICRNTK